MPPKLFAYKVIRKIRTFSKEIAEEYQAFLLGTDISNKDFQKLLKITKKEQKSWIKGFRYQLTKNSIFPERILFSEYDALHTTDKQIISEANLFKKHTFDLLGSGQVTPSYSMQAKGFEEHRFEMAPGEKAAESQKNKMKQIFGTTILNYQPIDWSIDFRSGYRWDPDTWYRKIKKGTPGTDIKIPWELSRFQHGLRLGQAFRLTGNKTYAAEIINEIIDWIIANPVGYGPNWKCTMEIAIRGANWINSLTLIHDSEILTDKVLWEIAKSLYQHGKFIRNHLEWSPWLTSNHYTSNLSGLFFIAHACPGLPKADQWQFFSQSQLEIEIKKQIYDDGCDFEASTYYHRLVTELFFYPALLAKRIGSPFSSEYLTRLESMFESIRILLHNNGEMPQVGDNDSGRFLIIEYSEACTKRMDYLLPIGDWFFKKTDQCFPKNTNYSLGMWLGLTPNLPGKNEVWENRKSHLFKDAGWAVLRNDRFQVMISCGTNGQNGNGGHAHNDKMSIELSVDGLPFIVDPGTYVYTSNLAARNKFRSVTMHSTPQLKKSEPNQIIKGPLGAFSLEDKCQAVIEKCNSSSFSGNHSGYGVKLKMELQLSKKILHCCYTPEKKGEWSMRWVLHPEAIVDKNSHGLIIKREKILLLLESDSNDFLIGTTSYSPCYGIIQECPIISKPFKKKLDWQLSCLE